MYNNLARETYIIITVKLILFSNSKTIRRPKFKIFFAVSNFRLLFGLK